MAVVPAAINFLLGFLIFSISPRRFWDDEACINILAIKDVYSSEFAFVSRPPERPVVAWSLEIAHYFFGASDFSARYMFLLLGSITILATYYFAKELFDERTALIASLILATLPCQIAWSGITRHTAAMTPFYVLSAYYFYRGMKHNCHALLYVASACLLVAYMGSEAAILLIPTIILYLVTTRSPASFRNKHLWGSFFLFAVGRQVVESIQRIPYSRLLLERVSFAEEALRQNPTWPLTKFLETYLTYILGSNFFLPLFCLVGICLFLRERKRAHVFCLIYVTLYTIFLSIDWKIRSFYALPLLPVFCISVAYWISNGFSGRRLSLRLLAGRNRRIKTTSIFITFILLTNLISLPSVFSERQRVVPELWNSAYDEDLYEFLKRQTSPTDIILIQPIAEVLGSTTYLLYEPTFGFYLNRPVAQLDRLEHPASFPPYFTSDYLLQSFGERDIYYVSLKKDGGQLSQTFPSAVRVFENFKFYVHRLLGRENNIIILRDGNRIEILSLLSKIRLEDGVVRFYMWEPWPDLLNPGRMWHEILRIRVNDEVVCVADSSTELVSYKQGMFLAKGKLKINLVGKELWSLTAYYERPAIDLCIEPFDAKEMSRNCSYTLYLEMVGNAVSVKNEPTIRYVSLGNETFRRIRKTAYACSARSPITWGLGSKYDQLVSFRSFNSNAIFDCRRFPLVEVSAERISGSKKLIDFRLVFLAGDSTGDLDTNGILDILQEKVPLEYRNRWGLKDNCETLSTRPS